MAKTIRELMIETKTKELESMLANQPKIIDRLVKVFQYLKWTKKEDGYVKTYKAFVGSQYIKIVGVNSPYAYSYALLTGEKGSDRKGSTPRGWYIGEQHKRAFEELLGTITREIDDLIEKKKD